MWRAFVRPFVPPWRPPSDPMMSLIRLLRFGGNTLMPPRLLACQFASTSLGSAASSSPAEAVASTQQGEGTSLGPMPVQPVLL